MSACFRSAPLAAAAVLFACGSNPQQGYGTVELSITLANNCAVPLNLDHVSWNLTLEGKAAGGASYTADQLSTSCARGTALGSVKVFVGHYVSTVAGYDSGSRLITNTDTQTVDVFVGGTPQVNATLFPETGSAAVQVTFECCVDPASPSSTGVCSPALTPGACTSAGSACVWACADMCCRGLNEACSSAVDVPSCNAASTACTWIRC